VLDLGNGTYLVQVLLPDDPALRGAAVALRFARARPAAPAPAPSSIEEHPPGAAIAAALDPVERVAENYRSRLHDLWDLHGLTTGENAGDSENEVGQPFVTSHYGFFLTNFFLVSALSGQVTDLAGGSPQLSFAPLYACPFNVPLLLAGRTGTVSCDAAGAYTVGMAFGSLQLPAGGLSVNGRAYPHAVALAAGEAVTW
jgi:non-lysosomal glucosylceramidase